MKNSKVIDYQDYIGNHTLIYGDINKGKTQYTANFVRFLVESGFNPKEITILDFSPNLVKIKDLKVGGKLVDYYKKCESCNFIELKGVIIPPRLTARTKKEIKLIAYRNYIKTSEALDEYIKAPTEILIINDISIYLHRGNPKKILYAMKKANTFFGNSYFGTSIKRKYIFFFDYKEKRRVKYLIKKMNRIIRL